MPFNISGLKLKPKTKARTTLTTQRKPNKPKPTGKRLNLSAKTLWAKSAELVSLEFNVYPLFDCELYPQYTIGLHAWFLQQIREQDAELSAYMHDNGSEKPFSMSGLSGQFVSHSQSLQLKKNKTYQWRVNGLCQSVAQGMAAAGRTQRDEWILIELTRPA